jgi:BASS family bile acid:Na+ symporter
VLFALGLGVDAGDLRAILRHRGLVARGVLSVLLVVPVASVLAVRMFGLPRGAEIGIVLMAIAPGAPVALRRSIGAGGHRAFAPVLQILVAALAIVSMPVSVAVLDIVYAGNASVPPAAIAGQVLRAQLLPLALGMLTRHLAPGPADRLARVFTRLGSIMLAVVVLVTLVTIGPMAVAAGPRLAGAMVFVTALALTLGHALGGPNPDTRTAVAICSAARNPGLALLVATLNRGTPEMVQTILAQIIVTALTLVPYVVWRRRTKAGSA